MTDRVTDRMNEQGILVTVLSLLMIVIYDESAFDGWDLLLSTATFFFSVSFLWKGRKESYFSLYLGYVIILVSVYTIFASIVTIFGIFPELNLCKFEEDPTKSIGRFCEKHPMTSIGFIVLAGIAAVLHFPLRRRIGSA